MDGWTRWATWVGDRNPFTTQLEINQTTHIAAGTAAIITTQGIRRSAKGTDNLAVMAAD